MTSNVNPNNIDGTYPVAGQDNDSQGFRDNFTNIKTNFTEAKTEIEDLQSKVILKSALTGTTLDNSGGGALLKDFETRDFAETRVAKGSTSGTVTCSYSEGSYQTVSTSGSITLAFTNFPASGKLGRIRVEVDITNTAHTVTLPAAVTVGTGSIQGYASNIITFDTTGTYIFEFTTHDAGSVISIQDLTRAGGLSLDQRTPATSAGQSGDVAGMIVVDASYIYICTGTYDGSTAVWKRVAISTF